MMVVGAIDASHQLRTGQWGTETTSGITYFLGGYAIIALKHCGCTSGSRAPFWSSADRQQASEVTCSLKATQSVVLATLPVGELTNSSYLTLFSHIAKGFRPRHPSSATCPAIFHLLPMTFCST